MRRIGISRRTRFEVFKRDLFVCVYCGAHPPGVLLEVDHVVAVSKGGGSEIDNLVTSCLNCNRGKGAVSLEKIPQSLAEKAKVIAEAEAQILGYQAILNTKRERVEEEMWVIAEELEPGSGEKGFPKSYLASIKRFNELLGVHQVLEAAEIASARISRSDHQRFRYFCGICWRKLRPDRGSEMGVTVSQLTHEKTLQ